MTNHMIKSVICSKDNRSRAELVKYESGVEVSFFTLIGALDDRDASKSRQMWRLEQRETFGDEPFHVLCDVVHDIINQ